MGACASTKKVTEATTVTSRVKTGQITKMVSDMDTRLPTLTNVPRRVSADCETHVDTERASVTHSRRASIMAPTKAGTIIDLRGRAGKPMTTENIKPGPPSLKRFAGRRNSWNNNGADLKSYKNIAIRSVRKISRDYTFSRCADMFLI